jgi:putative transposase
MSRAQYNYLSQRKEDTEVVRSILELKEQYPFYGVPRVLASLRRRGFRINGKRVYRIMKTLRLNVPRRQKRKKFFIPPSQKRPEAVRVGNIWSMDFIFDRLVCGDSFRCFTIIDNLSREVPGIFVSKSMAGFSPVNFLENLKSQVKLPEHIILDNGPEFANQPFVSWCVKNNISLHFIDPGKPVQNAFIESFNGKFRQEFLDQGNFSSIAQVKKKLESWIRYYNEERPHSSLDYLTPKEFANHEKSMLENKNNLLVLKTG